jgi:NADH:ubiquinone oxidoreductase subunit 3 (subunit A)
MPSSWDSYYIVFLSAILSLGIPGILALISYLFFQKSKPSFFKSSASASQEAGPNQTILGQRINVRFFLAANAALILITLGLELVPCATTIQTQNHEGLIKGLISIVTLAGFAVLGLLYSVRKGDMGWLSSLNTQISRRKEDE